MNIGFDFSPATINKDGIGHYTYALAKALMQTDKENAYTFFAHSQTLQSLYPDIPLTIIKESKPGLLWMYKTSKFLRENNFDYLVSTSNFLFNLLFSPTLQIIHDIAPIQKKELYPIKSRIMFRLTLQLATYKARRFAAISKTTKKEFINTFPRVKHKTEYIGTGMQSGLSKFNKSIFENKRIKSKYNLPEKYFLSVSTLQPRKNYKKMIEAFHLFQKNNQDYHYVIVGKKGWYFDEILDVVEKKGLSKYVHFLGYVPDEDIVYIFDQAAALLYLSYDEGFGIPPLEAYSRGVPSLVSDIPVLREVMQDKALYANPNNCIQIAENMKKILHKEVKIDAEFLNQYKWKEIAKRLIDLYKD